nr:hypothetical protein Itr_chr14CG00300 [Ipomoea trifida]
MDGCLCHRNVVDMDRRWRNNVAGIYQEGDGTAWKDRADNREINRVFANLQHGRDMANQQDAILSEDNKTVLNIDARASLRFTMRLGVKLGVSKRA